MCQHSKFSLLLHYVSVSPAFGALRITLSFVTIIVVVIALILDIRSTVYFQDDLSACNFGNIPTKCYCSATYNEYRDVFGSLGELSCNNVATRNTSILEANVAFSVGCLLLACMFVASLLTGLGSYLLAWLNAPQESIHVPIVAETPLNTAGV